jgi:excisionase family DNA binding protein
VPSNTSKPAAVHGQRYLSTRKASLLLGGKPSHPTIAKWARNGVIPGARIVGKQVLIPQSWVDYFLSETPDFLS